MKIFIKKPISCSWKEINIFYNFLGKLTLKKDYPRIKKIKNCRILGFCEYKNTIIGVSAIKKPNTSRTKKIGKKIGIHFDKNILEYGYVYINSKYRGLGISTKLYTKISKLVNNNIYATVKKDNFIMKKLLEQFGFTKKGTFVSFLDKSSIDLYSKM